MECNVNVNVDDASWLLLYRESWFTRLGFLAPELESLGRVLEDVQVFQEETLLHPLEDMFDPTEDFVKREVKTIRKVRVMYGSVYRGVTCIERKLLERADGDCCSLFFLFFFVLVHWV